MIHICYGLCDKKGLYSKFTGTSILSIFENTSAEVTVHILCDNTLSSENRQKFQMLAEKYNRQIIFYNVEKTCAKEIEEFKNKIPMLSDSRYTVGCMYRLLIPKIIPAEISKIIYLDSDIIVNLDINELWQVDISEKPLAAVAEINIDLKELLPGHFVIQKNFVELEDYFNSGVLIINLSDGENWYNKIMDGVNFAAENPQCNLFDQDILNYCFSKNYVKLPEKFDVFISVERIHNPNYDIRRAIYHYIGNELNLDVNDKLNCLWLEYFKKTTWFNMQFFLNINNFIQELYDTSQNKLVQISAVMSGKRRIFFAELVNFERFKQLFYISKAEEIIDATKFDALKILLKKMKKMRGAGFFILLVRNYSEIQETLTNAGFIEGIDFVNAADFLSGKHGMPFDSNLFIRAM